MFKVGSNPVCLVPSWVHLGKSEKFYPNSYVFMLIFEKARFVFSVPFLPLPDCFGSCET
jgi:hypothetical protein